MRVTKGAAATLAVAAGALALAAPAGAKTRTVKPGQSIQAAIDKANPGDTIKVKHGSYAESLTIGKNKLKLVGDDVTLTQPASPKASLCSKVEGSTKATGICVVGDVTVPQSGPPTVNKVVKDVEISGFTVRKFDDTGVFIFGAKDTVLRKSKLLKNGGYGSFSNTSSGTQYLHNVSKNNGDAGFYVGDSPKARATVSHNTSVGNRMGLLLRNATGGKVTDNSLSGNCAGIIVLAGAPGPAGGFTIQGNNASKNNKACPGTTDEPAISGIGIGLSGAHDTKVLGNKVDRNKHLHPSTASGGIVVQKGSGGTLPTKDLVKGNKLSKNSPFDLNWDGTGTVTFKKNTCSTSSPAGLCA